MIRSKTLGTTLSVLVRSFQNSALGLENRFAKLHRLKDHCEEAVQCSYLAHTIRMRKHFPVYVSIAWQQHISQCGESSCPLLINSHDFKGFAQRKHPRLTLSNMSSLSCGARARGGYERVCPDTFIYGSSCDLFEIQHLHLMGLRCALEGTTSKTRRRTHPSALHFFRVQERTTQLARLSSWQYRV